MKQRAAVGVLVAAAAVVGCKAAGSGAGADEAGLAFDAGIISSDARTVFVDDGGPSDGGLAAVSPLTGVRFANWAPDAPPIDVCLAPHGSSAFEGPLLGARRRAIADAGIDDDAGVPGLAFPWVSAYVYLPPGTYDARTVAAGSPDCTVAVVAPDSTSLVPLAAGAMATLAVLGDVTPPQGHPGVTMASFRDDFEVLLGDGGPPIVPMRFIHAAPSTAAMTVGTGSFTTQDFVQWFADVPFGGASTLQEAQTLEHVPPSPAQVDANGYAQLAFIAQQEVSVHAFKTSTDLARAPSVDVPPGIVVTLVAIGDAHLQLLVCQDTAGTVGLLSSCSVVSP